MPDLRMEDQDAVCAPAELQVELYKREIEEYEKLFDLRWKADMRAIKRWQEATGQVRTWPDHADLCVWLLEQLDATGTQEQNMVSLPRTCPHCKGQLYHYGVCRCPGATLDWIDAERKALADRGKRLDQIEREATAAKLRELGVIPAEAGTNPGT